MLVQYRRLMVVQSRLATTNKRQYCKNNRSAVRGDYFISRLQTRYLDVESTTCVRIVVIALLHTNTFDFGD